MPWAEITPDEEVGDFGVPISGFEHAPTGFGILHTPQIYAGKMIPDQKETADKKNTTVKKRTCFWRFKLSQGTDLTDVGMAVIYDNNDAGYFTLIPEEDRRAVTVHRWAGTDVEYVLGPKPGYPVPPAPEALWRQIGSPKYSLTFPMAAKKFKFHDFIMKASGLPCDMKSVGGDSEDEDNQDKKALGAASNIVFEYCIELSNTHGILEAPDALHKNEFKLKSVSTFYFEVRTTTYYKNACLHQAGELFYVGGGGHRRRRRLILVIDSGHLLPTSVLAGYI
jgi:hypothetical protein